MGLGRWTGKDGVKRVCSSSATGRAAHMLALSALAPSCLPGWVQVAPALLTELQLKTVACPQGEWAYPKEPRHLRSPSLTKEKGLLNQEEGVLH
jgi:hypothetical protein